MLHSKIFKKKMAKEWAQKHCINLVKYHDVGLAAVPSLSMCSPYDFLSDAAISGVVMCMARPQAVSQAKPGLNRPSQVGPKQQLHEGFGPAQSPAKPKPGHQAMASSGNSKYISIFSAKSIVLVLFGSSPQQAVATGCLGSWPCMYIFQVAVWQMSVAPIFFHHMSVASIFFHHRPVALIEEITGANEQ